MASQAEINRLGEDAGRSSFLIRSLFGRPSNGSYRAAVAQIIRDVKARNRLTNERLADILGCADTTVASAENEEGSLSAVTLLSIAYAFGEEAISPVRSLYLCNNADPKTVADDIAEMRRSLNALETRLEREDRR